MGFQFCNTQLSLYISLDLYHHMVLGLGSNCGWPLKKVFSRHLFPLLADFWRLTSKMWVGGMPLEMNRNVRSVKLQNKHFANWLFIVLLLATKHGRN